jgi:leucyl-tRNA synthetase
MTYNFNKIEKKWQKKWEDKKVFQAKENSKKKKYYVLEQFPYPSGSGLHAGHSFVYTIGDIYSRFKILQGFNVLHPMGYDSLGLPAENAAIKEGIHPKKYTNASIKNFMKQQRALGLSYDWSRVFWTHDPEYYKWDQWIFLKMFEKNLAYKKDSSVNWCSKCKTVLANEQVHNGKCWRHEDTAVDVKHLNQWYLKITDYAEELADFNKVKEWPDLIKKLQKNWIGKSHGTEIIFEINGKKWPIFTTRPDTIFGVTFMVVSAQHSKLMELVTKEQKKEVEKFVKKLSSVSQEDIGKLDKEGVFTGAYAINPINNEKIPVYAGNFVVADYGSGMVMAVPAHDQRDFEFAKKYDIGIEQVIREKQLTQNEMKLITKTDKGAFYAGPKLKAAYVGSGTLMHSGDFNGLESREAIEHITKWLENKKLGKKVINYRLRDWLISRQRYWGTPIPIVYCDKCGVVPVAEKNLPIKLPDKVKFGKGNPLETAESWIKTKCPKCNGKARRETDTMDTFVNSSWYHLRFTDSKNSKKIFDSKKANYWSPINIYIGGKEHACMHDIYIRFYHKFLRDLGLLKTDEPAEKLFVQGMIHGEDGNKMSKSLGNVVDPLDVIKKYGADSLRLFLISVAGPESDFNWSDTGIQGSYKFVNKIFNSFDELKLGKSSPRIESKLNKTIKEITLGIENFKYNLVVIKLRALLDSILVEEISKKDFGTFLKLLSPFCPHIAEELWEKLGNKKLITLESWPKANEKKINDKFEKEDEMVSKLKSDINNIKKILNKENAKVYVYVLPNELSLYKSVEWAEVFAVNDKNKYDPENKSKKVKPGRPGIYLE